MSVANSLKNRAKIFCASTMAEADERSTISTCVSLHTLQLGLATHGSFGKNTSVSFTPQHGVGEVLFVHAVQFGVNSEVTLRQVKLVFSGLVYFSTNPSGQQAVVFSHGITMVWFTHGSGVVVFAQLHGIDTFVVVLENAGQVKLTTLGQLNVQLAHVEFAFDEQFWEGHSGHEGHVPLEHRLDAFKQVKLTLRASVYFNTNPSGQLALQGESGGIVVLHNDEAFRHVKLTLNGSVNFNTVPSGHDALQRDCV